MAEERTSRRVSTVSNNPDSPREVPLSFHASVAGYALMSAFGGKADMPFCTAHVCFDPKRTLARNPPPGNVSFLTQWDEKAPTYTLVQYFPRILYV